MSLTKENAKLKKELKSALTKIKKLEKQSKDVLEGYELSILKHREFEHETTEKIELQEKELNSLKEGIKESDEYIKKVDEWLVTLKKENADLKSKLNKKNNKPIL